MAKATNAERVTRVNIYDCAALFNLGDSLKDEQGKPAKVSYGHAKTLSARAREEFNMSSAQLDIAFISVDPNSDPQRRFLEALSAIGIEQELIEFRHAFVSATPPTERAERRTISVSTNVAYLLGLLAERQGCAEIVVWSPNFDLYYPMKDLVEVRKGKAAIVYFRRFLDPRWGHSGLFEKTFPIKFFDVESESQALLGLELKKSEVNVSRMSGLRKI